METNMQAQRIAALEATYEHVATKADIANLRTEMADRYAKLSTDIESLRSQLTTLKWWIGIAVPLTALAVQLLDRAMT